MGKERRCPVKQGEVVDLKSPLALEQAIIHKNTLYNQVPTVIKDKMGLPHVAVSAEVLFRQEDD